MPDPNDDFLLKWSIRLLYLTMFLVLLLSFNILGFRTLPSIGAIIVLIYSGLAIAKEKVAFEEMNEIYLEKKRRAWESLYDLYLEQY